MMMIQRLVRACVARLRPAPPTSRDGELLASYAAASSRAREWERERKRLRELIDDIPAGVVIDGWQKRLGEPAEIVGPQGED